MYEVEESSSIEVTELWDIYDINRIKTGHTVDRGRMTEEIARGMIARGEYHITVHVWYKNSCGEFLISKRSPNKEYGNLWEPTGGSAISGEDSLMAALREAKEELSAEPDPKSGRLFATLNRSPLAPDFMDVWLFNLDMPIEHIILQEGETCDAMWATKGEILEMIDRGEFLPRYLVPYINELFFFSDKPFWEIGYSDKSVSTFQKGATKDLMTFYHRFAPHSCILDVGCGEGRNTIFLTEQGHTVDAFDLSKAGIEKAMFLASQKALTINFFVCDLGEYVFNKEYDVILSHGVLHLPEKETRDKFIESAQEYTKPGGYHIIGIFTNRLPATPDNAPFTKSLFNVGELPGKYGGWDILSHEEGTFKDSHPGGVSHEHAYESIIVRKPY